MTTPAYLIAALCVLGLALLAWGVAQRNQNTAVADIFWPLHHLVASIVFFTAAPNANLGQSSVVIALVFIWAVRLATHLSIRQAGAQEDHRYAAVRRRYGAGFGRASLFLIFIPQALMAFGISLIFPPVFDGSSPWTLLTSLCLCLSGIGLAIEICADLQLSAFLKRQPRSPILERGLWHFSRHPNYFGEWLFWLGLCGIALAEGAWYALLPLFGITYLLVRFTGIRRMEADIGNRNPAYLAYQARTPSFIPWKIFLSILIFVCIPGQRTLSQAADKDGLANAYPPSPHETMAIGDTRTWRFAAYLGEREIGFHQFLLQRANDGYRLKANAAFSYKLLGITVFSYEHEVEEHYSPDLCLHEIRSQTQVKGNQLRVMGRQTPEGFLVDSEAPSLVDQPCIKSFAYWTPELLTEQTLLNGQTGKMTPVYITQGPQKSTGQRHYELSGEKIAISLTYDARGNWVGLSSQLPSDRTLEYILTASSWTDAGVIAAQDNSS